MAGVLKQTRIQPVPVSELRKVCPALSVESEPGKESSPMSTFLGQQRAINAIQFGLQMEHDGYNIFVLGPPGSARHGLVEELAREPARKKGAPDDWCYINNFSDPERPRALRLPAGEGSRFRDSLQALIEEIRVAIPAAFESDDYGNQLKALEAETQKELEGLWNSLQEQAASEGIALLQTPTGYVLAPVSDDKVVDDKDFDKLPEEKRKEIKKAIQRLSEELKTRIETIPKVHKNHHQRVRTLDREVTAHAVSVLLRGTTRGA